MNFVFALPNTSKPGVKWEKGKDPVFAEAGSNANYFNCKKLVQTIDKQQKFMYNVFVYLCAREKNRPRFSFFRRKNLRKVVEIWHFLYENE